MNVSHFIYILTGILCFCSSAPLAHGQNDKLATEFQQWTDSCQRLNERINVLQTTKHNLDSTINSLNVGEVDIQGLENLLEQERNLEQQLRRDIDNWRAHLTELDNELSQMDEFASIRNKKIAEQNEEHLRVLYDQNKVLLTKRYSQITEDELAEIDSTKNQFQKLKGFSEYKKRIQAAKNNKDLYERGVTVLSEPYSSEVESIHAKIWNLLELQMDDFKNGVFKLSKDKYDEMDSQFEEMKNLDRYLSRFRDGTMALQGIINRVNRDKQIESFRNSNDLLNREACMTAIKSAIESYEYVNTNNKTFKGLSTIQERYFSYIPFLERCFNEYLRQLEESPLQRTQIEEEILKLKVK